jgi:hypothetical protein
MYNLVQETLLIADSKILWIALDKITHIIKNLRNCDLDFVSPFNSNFDNNTLDVRAESCG